MPFSFSCGNGCFSLLTVPPPPCPHFHDKRKYWEGGSVEELFFIWFDFTSFSRHGPAKREWAQMGLRSHAWCHPYPIQQPVKVGHTTEVYVPYSFQTVAWVLLCPTRTGQWKCCETGPTVFRPYPWRLESLTVCRCHYTGSTFFSVI